LVKEIDIVALRKRFPILNQKVNGHDLIYLDNAATTQKPLRVIDAMDNYYRELNSNVHRGVHHLSMKATNASEQTRDLVQNLINAKKREEIIFTSGTTESVNLVARSCGGTNLNEGDEVLISAMEHHSNIVPWQMICAEKKAVLRVIPISSSGEILMDNFEALLSERTKIVAVNHVSNALGTVNPVKELCRKAHEKGALVLIDGAQSIVHVPVDVEDIDCDFFCFSGHKMYGPTGIGVLYGKASILEAMSPFMGGGEMIKTVSFEGTTYNDLPYKFEAGTPAIAEMIGLGEAIKFWNTLDHELIFRYEDELLNYATERLKEIPDLKIYGEAKNKVSVISFLVGNIHPFDLGTLLDQMGIAIRTGHHCAEPLMDWFNIPGTCRASFSIYNTKEEIDQLKSAIEKAVSILG